MNMYEVLGNPFLKDIIKDIISASNDIGVDFFGVGALARNTWYADNDLPVRGTKDVDFGVYIPDRDTYSSLKTKLIQSYGYTETESNAFCIISPDKIPVDLLPFGDIEDNGKVVIEGKGLTSISLDGFEEVYKNGLRTVTIGEDTLSVCTIPSIVLLKLVAFDDRPEHRSKDPQDISSIMINYPDVETELIWDNYNFLYEGDREHEDIGIIVLGYEIRKLLEKNKELFTRVVGILNKGILNESSLASRMIINPQSETIESNIVKLKLLKEGLLDKHNAANTAPPTIG